MLVDIEPKTSLLEKSNQHDTTNLTDILMVDAEENLLNNFTNLSNNSLFLTTTPTYLKNDLLNKKSVTKPTQNPLNKKKTLKKNFYLPTGAYVTQRPPLEGTNLY